ncbi:hypothetical protein QJS04_geneDACA012480 [Acorus gramineus]|uniref:Sphingomyelin phosphodiesterase 4 n=1 Tax=Acorus gramineus TaxID=55184 RepID=A0AAV9BA45_ACOGR|nr:hypothetical protein QJS04_geneDACA012480 [Acorus gramineus]
MNPTHRARHSSTISSARPENPPLVHVSSSHHATSAPRRPCFGPLLSPTRHSQRAPFPIKTSKIENLKNKNSLLAMIPPSYTVDSQIKAQDLATRILSSTSPSQISSAASSVDSFLRNHSPDQTRPFFSSAFPALLCRLFGFDDSSTPSSKAPPSSTSWIDASASSPVVARKLFDLLSPHGTLLTSIASVDRHSLVRYAFPVERLPEWARSAAASDRLVQALPDLCPPLFSGRVKADPIGGSWQVQLNVFEYYLFWFAYYPVCRGNVEASRVSAPAVDASARKIRRFRLEGWTSSPPATKPEPGLYPRLLYAYLRAFVPNFEAGSYQQPYRSSLLHYSPHGSYDDGTAMLRAEFFVYALVHFWMVDNDFSPLPVNVCHSFGVIFPSRKMLREAPPTSGLGEVMKLFLKYLNCGSVGSPKQGMIFSWNPIVQRPLYRFVLRIFLFCPMETSIKNAAEVFAVWMSYVEPWRTNTRDFAEFEATSAVQTRKEGRGSQGTKGLDADKCRVEDVYSPVWEDYVVGNYLFYSSLVVHFIGFAHKFLPTNTEVIVQMVLKVLKVLTSTRVLLDLLRKIDASYHSKPARSSSAMFGSSYKYVLSIREQLKDWEDGLSERDADGSFLHENWNCDLKLFSDSEDGAHHLLQLLVVRAQHEFQGYTGENATRNLQTLDALKSQMGILFGSTTQRTLFFEPEEEIQAQHGRDEVFTPKHPGIGKRTWADTNYKGDWMRRPTSDNEIAWLARLLVRVSDWLNRALGLDRPDSGTETGPTYIEMVPEKTVNVGGLKEAMWLMFILVWSWLRVAGKGALKFMRKHELRINLRILASKKAVMVLLVCVAALALQKAIGHFFC